MFKVGVQQRVNANIDVVFIFYSYCPSFNFKVGYSKEYVHTLMILSFSTLAALACHIFGD